MDPLVTRVERYLARSGRTSTQLGQLAFSDPLAIEDLRKGHMDSHRRGRLKAYLDDKEPELP